MKRRHTKNNEFPLA